MKVFIVIFVSIFITTCSGQGGGGPPGGEGGKGNWMEKICSMPKNPEIAKKMDEKHTAKKTCMKEKYANIEDIEKGCWATAFEGKPMPASGSQMFQFMCDNKDAVKGGMKKMMVCSMDKMVEEEKKKNPNATGRDVWEKAKTCHPKMGGGAGRPGN